MKETMVSEKVIDTLKKPDRMVEAPVYDYA